MRKTTFGIGENKAADQLCSDCQTWSETRIVRFLMHGSCFVSRSEGPLTPPHMIPASPTDHENTGMIPTGGKTNNVVSEQARHKPTCTATENS